MQTLRSDLHLCGPVSYTHLDVYKRQAQYWGVAQRRKRIFLVADFAGRSAPQILFEQDRLFGNPAQSQGERQGTSATAQKSIRDSSGSCTVGFDGYNGDMTGDKAATLGVNCGMSTGRNGIIRALAANQRLSLIHISSPLQYMRQCLVLPCFPPQFCLRLPHCIPPVWRLAWRSGRLNILHRTASAFSSHFLPLPDVQIQRKRTGFPMHFLNSKYNASKTNIPLQTTEKNYFL